MTEPRGERKVVTVVFAGLVGFTERAETLDPATRYVREAEALLRESA